MSSDKVQGDLENSPDYKSDLKNDLSRVESIAEGEGIPDEHGQFHRSFTPRQVHIISLGSNIGSGVFIGTGKALANGGPGNMVIAYGLVCSCVWAVIQSLFEMTIAFPTSGNFIDYADRWVDPALAFGAGFAEWLGWTAIVAAEAAFFNILLGYWSTDALPEGAALTLFVVATAVIFALPNKVFAWFEYVTSIIKIFLFLIIILLGIALIAGAGPNGTVHNGSTWTELPAFKNGFFGFANCALLATWAVGDQVFIGIMGGETESPRFSLAHAAKLVPFRVSIIYMLSVIFIGILVPSNDDRLLGGSGVTASPFIIAVNDAGIPGIGHILNCGMIVGILAISAESIYLASRVLRTMSYQGLISTKLAKIDAQGRPRWALIITTLVAVVLTYINLSREGIITLNWLVSITSASFFTNWIIIAWTSFRFRAALKAQNDPLFTELYAWKSIAYPLAPGWLMTISVMLAASCFAMGIGDLSKTDFDAESFFSYIIGILIIGVFTLGYKLIYRTKFRDLKTCDLTTGRRTLSQSEIAQLDAYYSMPTWRRFGTYVQLW